MANSAYTSFYAQTTNAPHYPRKFTQHPSRSIENYRIAQEQDGGDGSGRDDTELPSGYFAVLKGFFGRRGIKHCLSMIEKQFQQLTTDYDAQVSQNEKQNKMVEPLRAKARQLREQRSQLKAALQVAYAERDAALQSRFELSAALCESEKALQFMKAEASAMQEFKKTERSDGQTLIRLFDNVLEDVDDLVHSIIKDLDLGWALNSKNVEAVTQSDSRRVQQLRPFFDHMLVCQLEVADFIAPAITSIVNSVVVDYILTPFCANVPDQSFNKNLDILVEKISHRESQEKSGRWRAMAFHALRTPENDDNITARVQESITWHLARLFAALRSSADADNNEMHQSRVSKTRTTALVEGALKLHDAAQGEYVSVDYQVFLPFIGDPALPVDICVDAEAEQELAQTGRWTFTTITAPNAVVLLPTRLGLRASRVDTRGVVSEVVCKAKALLVPGFATAR